MGAPELLALSLGLSVVVAALGWVTGQGVERLSGDPRLRDRVWAAALILPALPPLAVGLLLLTPAPVRVIAPPPTSLPIDLVTAPVEFAAADPSPALALDPTLAAWAVLGMAVLLAAFRLTALSLRTGRLLRIIGRAQAPSPAVTAMVEITAHDLAIRPPCVGVSAATSEALLASLGRARLILPVGLCEAANADAARAVIAHELAHLKRGDHRAVWLEEALLALLAANPLMPVLRARRAAAREEACDALALGKAAPEIRRAYARSLIEALRDRAGPQASGGLPALTFTGAGRTTAMRRLKAVLNPAPAAGRGSRLMALGLGGLIAVLAGAGSLAVAAEREAVFRDPPVSAAPFASASAATSRPPIEAPGLANLGMDARELLNGSPLPEGLPVWALSPERVDIRTAEDGAGTVNFILPFSGKTPVSVNGHLMPEGFPASGVTGDAVARVDVVGNHVLYTLKPAAEVRRARREAEAAVPQAPASHLTPEQQARYRNASAREYQALCASRDPGDDGFCSGVMFNQLGGGICPSPSLDQGDRTARSAALAALVERGKAEIARSTVRPGDTPGSLARAALARAYPCDAAALQTSEPAAPRGAMARPLDQADAAALGDAGGVVGESVLLTLDIDLAPGVLTTPEGTLMVRIQPTGGRPRTRLQFPVGGAFDPIPMGVAVKGSAGTPENYAITAEIRDANNRVVFATPTPIEVTASTGPVRAAVTLAPTT